MKISGVVEVSNRDLPSLNITNKRPQKSYLSVGVFSEKVKEPYILHQTLCNSAGVKYKIKNNIQEIFIRFIAQGKATIRFNNPKHDLIIKCPPEQLKSFVQIIKHCVEGKLNTKSVALSNLSSVPKKISAAPKTKLFILSKKEYPTLEGFPRSLEILQINDAELCKFDTRILRLQHLRVLNLRGNKIETLPPQIDLLPNLRELYLSKNNLGLGKDWLWLTSLHLRDRLQLLDLRSNQLTFLPKSVIKLKALKNLSVDDNDLARLPNGIGHLSRLQYLSVSNNYLEWLPGSIRLLRLVSVDISNNISYTEYPEKGSWCLDLPSLVDISAQTVLSNRLEISERELPKTLVDYLEEACYCECGKATFPSSPQCFVPFRLKRIATMVTFTTAQEVRIAVRFCSPRCYFNHRSH